MTNVPRKRRWLGFMASMLSGLAVGNKVRKPDLKEHDFRTSTRRIGFSFTDKLRDAFRRRWIKKM